MSELDPMFESWLDQKRAEAPLPSGKKRGPQPGMLEERNERLVGVKEFDSVQEVALSGTLTNHRVTNRSATRTFEKPWHRAAAYHFASGMTLKEVAAANDVNFSSVKVLVKTPWFQQNVTAILAENGGRDIVDMFKAEQFNSLVTLVELRDNEKVSASVRKSCASDILDRAMGKAVQRIETSSSISSADPVAEVARLRDENERLSRSSSLSA